MEVLAIHLPEESRILEALYKKKIKIKSAAECIEICVGVHLGGIWVGVCECAFSVYRLDQYERRLLSSRLLQCEWLTECKQSKTF